MSKHMMAQSMNTQFNSDVSILEANDAQIHLSKHKSCFPCSSRETISCQGSFTQMRKRIICAAFLLPLQYNGGEFNFVNGSHSIKKKIIKIFPESITPYIHIYIQYMFLSVCTYSNSEFYVKKESCWHSSAFVN